MTNMFWGFFVFGGGFKRDDVTQTPLHKVVSIYTFADERNKWKLARSSISAVLHIEFVGWDCPACVMTDFHVDVCR